MMKKSGQCLILWLIVCFHIGPSWAESQETALRDIDIKLERSNLQNGMTVAMNLCVLCHSLKYVRFQDLMEIGVSSDTVDDIRGVNQMSDPILSKMNSEQMNALFGMTTPDLSLVAKARKNGVKYVYSLLLAYHERRDGAIINNLFPDIKMPDVFAYSIENDERTRLNIEQNAHDVAAFLTWTADPKVQERHTLGIYVMIYLFVLTFLIYLMKRKIWSRLDS